MRIRTVALGAGIALGSIATGCGGGVDDGAVADAAAPGHDELVPGATITAWAGDDVGAAPLATAVADDDARYALTLPAGTTRVAWRAEAPGYLDTYLLNQRYELVGLAPAARLHLQVWGFLPDQDPTTDALTLIAELGAPVLADAIVTASAEARRTE